MQSTGSRPSSAAGTASTPAQPPRTRDELLALGKTDATWAFLSYAASAMQQLEGDQALRWLIALHLAKLGLGTAANEQLALMTAEARALPEVQMVAKLAGLVGTGIVQPQAILSRLPSVLSSLPARLAQELTPAVPALKQLLATHDVMLPRHGAHKIAEGEPVSDDIRGCILRPKGETNLLTWTGGFDAIATAREWVASRTGKQSQLPCIVIGLCPPQPAYGVAVAGKPQPGTPIAKITIIEPDAARALLGLVLLDDLSPFFAEHVQVLAGPGASERYAKELKASTGALPMAMLTLAREDTTPLGHSLAAHVQAAHEAQAALVNALKSKVQARAAARDAEYARSRIEAGLAPGTTQLLRVLLATTRYSTFVQHSTQDLAESFSQLGAKVHVLIEAAPGELLTAASYLQAIDEHDPDLFVMVNYGRAHLQKVLPASLPLLTFVQDALPNLLSEANAKTQGPLDILAGVRMPELVRTFGYDASRVLPAPVPVSPRKFYPDASTTARGTAAPDIAFISHHSAPPQVLHAELLAQQDSESKRSVLQALYPICERLAKQQPWNFKQALRAGIQGVLAAHGMPSPSESFLSAITHGYCLRICDRVLRHEMLSWAIAISKEQGLSLALVGNGWDEHEQFARFARPAAPHGDALRELYASAGCCLHASMHGVLHQRVFECAMSGGLPLCRNTINAAWPAFARARALVAQALAGTPLHFEEHIQEHATTGAQAGWRVHPASWPALRDAIDLVTRLGVPRDGIVESDGCVRILQSYSGVQDVDEVASGIILPASETFFGNHTELQQLALRAARDSKWRSETSRAIADACADTVTTDAVVARALAMMVVGQEVL